MEVKDLSTLVRIIEASDSEHVEKLVKEFGNHRYEVGLNSGWDKCRSIYRFFMRQRKKRFKNHILEMDEYSAMISVVSFTRYFAALEDLLREYNEKGSLEVKACVNDVNELMYQLLDDKIKIDRRSIFQKD